MPCGNAREAVVIPALPAGMVDLACVKTLPKDPTAQPLLGLAQKTRSVLFLGCPRHCCSGGQDRAVSAPALVPSLPARANSASTAMDESLVGDDAQSQETAGGSASEKGSLDLDYSVMSGSSRCSSLSDGLFTSRCSASTLDDDAEEEKVDALLPSPSKDEPAFGWFEELDVAADNGNGHLAKPALGAGTTSLADPLGNPIPADVLEDSLETQALWYLTNSRRPPQPQAEREHFELMWTMNNERSAAPSPADDFDGPAGRGLVRSPSIGSMAFAMMPWLSGLGAAKRHLLRSVLGETPQEVRRACAAAKQPPRVLARFSCARSSAAAKSFTCTNSGCQDIASVTLRLSAVRVVQGHDGLPYAEYHIVVTNEGLTFGVWRRFSHFKTLRQALRRERGGRFRKAEGCWEEVQQHQRWLRCIEPAYLQQKAFLLQRFLYQVLADSAHLTVVEGFLCL